MEASKFIAIQLKKSANSVKMYIDTYESTKNHNFMQNIFFNTPYLSTVVRLIQAEKAGVIGNAAWKFKMDYSADAVYSALKQFS